MFGETYDDHTYDVPERNSFLGHHQSSDKLNNSNSTLPPLSLRSLTNPADLVWRNSQNRTLSPHELAYQESLIQEREAEIREIESGIHELSTIFRDLGTLVHEQGGMLGQ